MYYVLITDLPGEMSRILNSNESTKSIVIAYIIIVLKNIS